jgi:hypothetical protein
MAIGRSERRAERRARVEAIFGKDKADAALDLLELTELAWHDCYGEITPSETVVDDILVYSGGDLGALVHAARLAVQDFRDVRVAADDIRAGAKHRGK